MVADFEPFGTQDTKSILTYVAAVEAQSNHPIARALVKHCKDKFPETSLPIPEGMVTVPGKGVKCTVVHNGVPKTLHVGSVEYVAEVAPASETVMKHVGAWRDAGKVR